MSHYKLGTYAGGVGGMVDLCALLDTTKTDPYPTTYQEYTEQLDPDLNGAPIEAGPPVASWHWDWLPQPDIDALQSICSGASAQVYMRTRVNTGVQYDWQTFTALMLRPAIGDMIAPEAGKPLFPQGRGPVDVQFLNLVAV